MDARTQCDKPALLGPEVDGEFCFNSQDVAAHLIAHNRQIPAIEQSIDQ